MIVDASTVDDDLDVDALDWVNLDALAVNDEDAAARPGSRKDARPWDWGARWAGTPPRPQQRQSPARALAPLVGPSRDRALPGPANPVQGAEVAAAAVPPATSRHFRALRAQLNPEGREIPARPVGVASGKVVEPDLLILLEAFGTALMAETRVLDPTKLRRRWREHPAQKPGLAWRPAATAVPANPLNPAHDQVLASLMDTGPAEALADGRADRGRRGRQPLEGVVLADETGREWAARTPRFRADIRRRWYDLLVKHGEQIVRLITPEMGKATC